MTSTAAVHSPPPAWVGEVEQVQACPACRSTRRTLVFAALRDVVFGVAGGTWQMYRCAGCGAHYVDPRPTRSSILAAYDDYYTHAAAEDASLLPATGLTGRLRNDYLAARLGYPLPDRHPAGRWLLRLFPARRRRYERMVRGLAPPTGSGRLLDVGCGNGEFLIRMRDLGWKVFGYEVDPGAAAGVRAHGIRVFDGNLEDAGADGAFEVVTSSHVIEHVHDPIELLRTCRALLAPAGKLTVATPNIEGLGFRRFGAHWRGLECPRHLVVFSRRGLEQALTGAGFDNFTVRATIGPYGMIGTSVALDRRLSAREPVHQWRVTAENLAGDAIMLAIAGLGEELVAVATR